MKNLDTFLDNYSIWKNEKHFIIQEKISDKMEEYFKKSEKYFHVAVARNISSVAESK